MRENRRALTVALALAFLPVASSADGEPDAPPQPCCNPRVDSYRNFTRQVLDRCSQWVQVRYRESISIVDVAKLHACIAHGVRDSRAQHDAALRVIRRRAAREALYAYQTSFESALEGVEPTPDEGAAAYDQRQISLHHLLAHAWTRYELEER
jgi:hypothetical protein